MAAWLWRLVGVLPGEGRGGLPLGRTGKVLMA